MALRIGIDCRLPHYQKGGISQYTLELIQSLAKIDGENDYTLFHMDKDPDSYIPQGSASRFQRIDVYTPCHHRLERWTLGLEIVLRQPRLDILHSPDFIPPQVGGRKQIITVHDLNFLYYPQFLTRESLRYYRDQIRWATDHADHVSADSEKTRQDLIDLLNVPAGKITTVHLSVNDIYQRRYTPAERDLTLAKYRLPSTFVLFVGTLEPRKNLPMLLKAFDLARSQMGVELPLVFVGRKGWLFEEIFETISRLSLEPYVRHLSSVSNIELAHLYQAAGLLATPSHYEGFGLPALEALNCGCPVLVSDRGSLPEIVGDGGIILDADDHFQWAEAMALVLQNQSLREELVAAGYRQAASFSWADAAAKTLDIYKKVVG